MIYVVHVNSAPKNAIYIGRPSILGNPYKMRSESDRSRVITLYAAYLQRVLRSGTAEKRELDRICALARIQDVYLACHCAPKACHGDIIKSYIEKEIAQ